MSAISDPILRFCRGCVVPCRDLGSTYKLSVYTFPLRTLEIWTIAQN